MYVIRLVAVAAYFQHSSTERPRAGLGYLNKSVRVPSPLLDSTLFPSLPPHSRDPKVDLLGNSLVAATACFHSSPNILEILDHEETMFIRQVCIKIFITCYTPILYNCTRYEIPSYLFYRVSNVLLFPCPSFG